MIPEQRPDTSYDHGVPRGEAQNPAAPRGIVRDQLREVRDQFFSDPQREKGASTWKTLRNYLKTAVDLRDGAEFPKGWHNFAGHIREWIQDPQVFQKFDRMNRVEETSVEYLALRDELTEDYIGRAPVESKVSVRWKAEVARIVEQLAPESAKAQRQTHLHLLVKALEGKQGKGAEVAKAKSWWAAKGLSMAGGIDPTPPSIA